MRCGRHRSTWTSPDDHPARPPPTGVLPLNTGSYAVCDSSWLDPSRALDTAPTLRHAEWAARRIAFYGRWPERSPP